MVRLYFGETLVIDSVNILGVLSNKLDQTSCSKVLIPDAKESEFLNLYFYIHDYDMKSWKVMLRLCKQSDIQVNKSHLLRLWSISSNAVPELSFWLSVNDYKNGWFYTALNDLIRGERIVDYNRGYTVVSITGKKIFIQVFKWICFTMFVMIYTTAYMSSKEISGSLAMETFTVLRQPMKAE